MRASENSLNTLILFEPQLSLTWKRALIRGCYQPSVVPHAHRGLDCTHSGQSYFEKTMILSQSTGRSSRRETERQERQREIWRERDSETCRERERERERERNIWMKRDSEIETCRHNLSDAQRLRGERHRERLRELTLDPNAPAHISCCLH